MKREIFGLILALSLVLTASVVSAEIIINQEPNSLYNLGDIVEVFTKIVTASEVNSHLVVSSICNGVQTSVRSQDIFLSAGQEETIDLRFLLNIERLGRTNGVCVVKFSLDGFEPILTKEFKISDKINVKLLSEDQEADPGQTLSISGEAIKENGEAVKNGFVDLAVKQGNSSIISVKNTVQNGFFILDYSLPEKLKAGKYLVTFDVYELDSKGQKTNKGFASYNINVKQVPTSLEMVIEKKEILPGSPLRVKSILHDQTGEKIDSVAIIKIINPEQETALETEIKTDEFLEFATNTTQPPATWEVISTFGEFSVEDEFKILENKKLSIEFLNRTIFITNTGNVFYNDTLLVRLDENSSVGLDVVLDVGKNQKYVLTAPEGNYSVRILENEEVLFNENLFLTGNVISARELSERTLDVIQYPLVWIFFMVVLGFAGWVFFKRVYKKSFLGKANLFERRKHSTKAQSKTTEQKAQEKVYMPKPGTLLINTQNIAELSLSIQGEKQASSIICIQLKNPGEVRVNKHVVEETMKKLALIAEENKAMIYENQGTILFIFAPIKTRTFKNELPAIIAAGKIKDILTEHNRFFKQKINFGISLNHGYMIVRQEGKNLLRFMVLGTLITLAKKLATLSDGEPLLSEDIRKNIMSDIKTEKRSEGDLDFHVVKEIRDQEERRKFVNDFVRKMKQQEQEKQ